MKCPICEHVLYKKHEGLACKNWKCKLHSKLGKGWFYIERDNPFYVPEQLNESSRLTSMRNWMLKKQDILRRDNYTCQVCNKRETDGLNPLNVHHIISESKNKALAFDDENLITLCIECHSKQHLKDKHSWFRGA